MKDRILIRKYEPTDLATVADCYATGRIWSEKPWQEHRKCPHCPEGRNNFGLDSRKRKCPACNSTLEHFWNPSAISEDISRQLALPKAGCFVAITTRSRRLVGFTWGYQVEPTFQCQIPQLGIELPVYSKLIGRLTHTENQMLAWDNILGYIDEVGVHWKYRRQGIGKLLTLHLLHHFSTHGIVNVMLRTDERAIAAVRLYEELGFERDMELIDPVYENRGYWIADVCGLADYATEHNGILISPRTYAQWTEMIARSAYQNPGYYFH